LNGFKQLVDQIAESKKVSADQLVQQLNSGGGPSLANVTVRKRKNKNNFMNKFPS